MKRAIKRQRTIVGRLQREIERMASAIGAAVREALGETLSKAARIMAQSGQRKTADGQPKLYAWHAPEVDCISKGKAKLWCGDTTYIQTDEGWRFGGGCADHP